MTEAEAKRTRLKVWRDLLVAAGGTPLFNDTLYITVRRLAVVSGLTGYVNKPLLLLAKFILEGAGGTLYYNDTLYQTERKLMIALGADVPCCNMPPLQFMPGAPYSPVPPEGGIIFGNPDEEIMFGDPDSGIVFGNPDA